MKLSIVRIRSALLAGVALSVFFVGLVGCDSSRPTDKSTSKGKYVPNVVTGDIRAGIEKHIAEQVRLGDGYFKLPFKGKELKLRLVRVHVEYLASLGPQYHFACVDLAGADGEFYDVDFFMRGDPGSMKVTETTVHKINGQPLYLWKQKPDKSWGRVPVDDASKQLQGVINGKDKFEFTYHATLPKIDGPAQAWVPLAQSDQFQTIKILSIKAPGKQQKLKESKYGNEILHLELGPQDSGKAIEVKYLVERIEKAAYPGSKEDAKEFLAAENLVPDNETIRKEAEAAVKDKKGDLVRARALYDKVIEQMRYMKYGDGWGKGDAVYACSAKYGNCTDFHAYFIALCRSVGIPARFAIGAAVPSNRDDGGVDGYHCWAEFFADGKWYPVDISEADKFTALSMYYFGHHPANRIEFSRGRDLIVDPLPKSGPINFLAYPVLEINGKPIKVDKQFTFERKP